MIKTKVTFLKGRLFSSQSEVFENFLNCYDWLDKSRLSLFTWSIQKWLFWRAGFNPANQSNL